MILIDNGDSNKQACSSVTRFIRKEVKKTNARVVVGISVSHNSLYDLFLLKMIIGILCVKLSYFSNTTRINTDEFVECA
jgi:hypothetical protein